MLLKIRGIISFYMIGFVVAGLFHASGAGKIKAYGPHYSYDLTDRPSLDYSEYLKPDLPDKKITQPC